jgi:hypothetical protein
MASHATGDTFTADGIIDEEAFHHDPVRFLVSLGVPPSVRISRRTSRSPPGSASPSARSTHLGDVPDRGYQDSRPGSGGVLRPVSQAKPTASEANATNVKRNDQNQTGSQVSLRNS